MTTHKKQNGSAALGQERGREKKECFFFKQN